MTTMQTAIYQAMLTRISVMPREEYFKYPDVDKALSDKAIVYRFNADGLGEDVYGFVHPMTTKNLWNVAQRFYSFLRYEFESDDAMNQALLNN